MTIYRSIFNFYSFFFYLVTLLVVDFLLRVEQENLVFISRENEITSIKKDKKLKFFVNHGNFIPASSNTTSYEIISSPREDFKDVDIVFGLKTVFHNRYKRDKIRNSFGNPELYKEKYNVKFLFLLGKEDEFDENSILDEQLLFDDILYGSFKDSYWNLTYKEIMFYTWTEQNAPNVKFIYRGDDDNFLNPLGLMKFFDEYWKEAHGEPALWGGLIGENLSMLGQGKTAEEIREKRKAAV